MDDRADAEGRRTAWGSDDRPDLFNCGKVRGLLAIVGFLLMAVALDAGLGIDPNTWRFYAAWATYWLPVTWLLRKCLWPPQARRAQ